MTFESQAALYKYRTASDLYTAKVSSSVINNRIELMQDCIKEAEELFDMISGK